jgi:hypothetical protein
MKIDRLITTGLAAFAAALLTGQQASAAIVQANSNDIFLGFRVTSTGTQGAETAYLVKLGTYSLANFPNTVGTTFALSLGNINADLIANFGANWSTRADLGWGIFGSQDGATPTVLLTSRERVGGVVGVQSTPWPSLTIIDAAGPRNSILETRNYINAGGGSQSTANSNFGFLQNVTDTGTYFQALSPSLSPGAPDFTAWESIEGNFGGGVAGTALDLYRFNVVNDTNTVVAYRGTFSISGTGVVTYSNLAVPEPTTAALTAVAGGMLLGLRRRRSTSAI